MGFEIVGIVNSARALGSKDGSYHFYAMDVITSRGDKAVCQVWDNHPLYATLVQEGEQLINHRVRVTVLNYSVAQRELKDKQIERFIRYRIGAVADLGIPADESVLAGLVTSARAITNEAGSYNFLAFEIVTNRGITYPCQMWDDDPQFVELGPTVANLIDHRVQATVKKLSVRDRKMKDGPVQLQASFSITSVADLGLDQ